MCFENFLHLEVFVLNHIEFFYKFENMVSKPNFEAKDCLAYISFSITILKKILFNPHLR